MDAITKIIKMDFAICKKSMLIMIFSMLVAGVGCLFFLTPLLLGFFVVGSTAVVSSIFAVENKSNMEFFYGCFPIPKQKYIIGRSLTCLLVMTIPSVISIAFVQIGKKFSFYQFEELRILTEATAPYQMMISCAMIMIGFVGGANLLLVAFVGKVESREIFEVLLLLFEGLLAGIVRFFIQKTVYHGDSQAFFNAFKKWLLGHELTSCILLVLIGLIVLIISAWISLKIFHRKRI